ncbi:arylsulfatase [Pseudozobellia sp. WGM2]|uniref:arylsulfatase n=1 Tax=Pseudozobellia sp. WGM2 TaxID=2787625 RepID=UPI001FD73F4E|nr:arylsulfatase [Pseudozobellia sp. WGM2]
MKVRRILLYVFIISTYLSAFGQKRNQNPNNPNVIYILADDLGYGDLSCLGQTKFDTPHIDQLAQKGMIFTQHYSGSTVCAPSRSVLMTGQHTGHTPIRGNNAIALPNESLTLAEILKAKGYTTGAFGKWGLGKVGSEGDPLQQGFDRFYGFNNQSLAHNYYPYFLWDNDSKIELTANKGTKMGQYAPELIHKKAMEFIDINKDNAFFLYYPSILPHAELVAPERYMKKFRGKFGTETPYIGVDDGPRFRKGPYASQENPHAAFAAMITLLDEQVGEIVEKLEKLKIAENTLIIFTSDNGPHKEGGADPEFFNSNGPFKGVKRDLYEGGIHVPMIASWPKKIKAGSKTDHISAFWDILPTCAEIIGTEKPKDIDGISLLPTLLGNENLQQKHEYLYWEFYEKKGRQAVRMGDWKGIRYDVKKGPNAALELYNLANDKGETTDVSKENSKIVAQIMKIIEEAHDPSEIYNFN